MTNRIQPLAHYVLRAMDVDEPTLQGVRDELIRSAEEILPDIDWRRTTSLRIVARVANRHVIIRPTWDGIDVRVSGHGRMERERLETAIREHLTEELF